MKKKASGNTYRERLPDVLQNMEGLSQLRAKLPTGKNFEPQRVRTISALGEAQSKSPELIKAFFRRFPVVSPGNIGPIDSFLKREVKDNSVRQILRQYVDFSIRFKVRVTPTRTAPYFHVEPDHLPAALFHGKVFHGCLFPWLGTETQLSDYEDRELKIPKTSEQILASGAIKWFEVEDPEATSLLAQIEEVAYQPDAIVFVLHEARRPFLFCMIGENVSDALWKKAGQMKTKFQQQTYKTATRGRRPNTEQRSKEYEQLQTKLPSKLAAIELVGPDATEKAVSSQERALRRRKTEMNTKSAT